MLLYEKTVCTVFFFKINNFNTLDALHCQVKKYHKWIKIYTQTVERYNELKRSHNVITVKLLFINQIIKLNQMIYNLYNVFCYKINSHVFL